MTQSDVGPEPQPTPEVKQIAAPSRPYPWMRLVYSAVFAFASFFVLHLTLLLALLQFILRGLNGEENAEIRSFSRNLIAYLGELLAYASFVREDRPFPFAPFPKQDDSVL